MQKQGPLIITALFLLLPATGFSAPAKTFISHYGYQISTPAGWVARPGPCDSKITTVFYSAVGKDGQLSVPSVEVMARPMAVMTMEKLVSYTPWMVAGTFAHFHQTSAGYTTLDGLRVFDIKGTYPRGRRTIAIRELFTMRHGEAYIITTGYPVGMRSACEATSNQVISSIRWHQSSSN